MSKAKLGCSVDADVKTSTYIHLPSSRHGVAPILASASASSLLDLSINHISILSQPCMAVLTACRYDCILGSRASNNPSPCIATNWESMLTVNLFGPKCFDSFKPTRRASYLASLFVTKNARRLACLYSFFARANEDYANTSSFLANKAVNEDVPFFLDCWYVNS